MENVGPEEKLEEWQQSGRSPAPQLAAECQVCGAVGTGARALFVLLQRRCFSPAQFSDGEDPPEQVWDFHLNLRNPLSVHPSVLLLRPVLL